MAVKNKANGATAERSRSKGKESGSGSGQIGKARNPETSEGDCIDAEGRGKLPLDSPEFKPIIRDLIRLAKEQGYLTFDDINEAIPDAETDIELFEDLIERLRTMKFRIIDAAEVDNLKAGAVDDDDDDDEGDDAEEPDEKKRPVEREGRLDILDDPVRMYLKQMGQVPLLTREQEVDISKRIERSETEIRKILTRFGFIPDAYLEFARRLEKGEERFDRLIIDKKVESRARYLKTWRSSVNRFRTCATGSRQATLSFVTPNPKPPSLTSRRHSRKTTPSSPRPTAAFISSRR